VTSDMPFCLIYTAAMGGKPRGAVLTHGNIVTANLQTLATMSLTHKDAYLNLLPLFHITGLNLCFAVMHAGGKNVILPKFDAENALILTQRENVTVMGSFPPMLANLEQAMDKGAPKPASLRSVLGLDAPDTIARFEAKTGAVFWMLYGQTETSGMVTFSPASEKPGSAGRQGMMIRMAVVDAEDRPLPTGEIGEIVVQGPLVFQGFWNLEADTRAVFRNGRHHTGDNGCMDEDGYLWFKGRKPEKELIKPGGENVYPAEVEKVILEHPDVAEVSVIGVPDPKFGEGIKAVCVLKSGAHLTSEALIHFVGKRIARYKKPRYVDFVPELPKKPDGTIDRDKVKASHGG
jgi:acyl-CoA synthetase (AMP-forming)/AMP-acid ligase II